jgi:hypothetical protein
MRPALPAALALAGLLSVACGTPQAPPPPPDAEDAGAQADAGAPPADAGHTDAGGPDAGPTDAGYSAIAVQGWCEALAVGFCYRARRCLQIGDEEWTACITRRRSTCDQVAFTAGVKDQRLAYDPGAAAACINGYAQGSCVPEPPACADVFTAQVAPPGACLLEAECMSGSFCLTWANTCPYTCYPYRAVGQTCNYWDQQCDPQTGGCAQVNGVNTCVARKPEGTACVYYSDCALGLACVQNVCTKEVAALGEPCRERQGYPYCEPDTFCRQDPPSPGGEAPPGVCMRKAALGGVCSGYGTCLTGLRCSSNYATGTCIPLGAVGDGCTNYNDCRLELYCATKTGRCEVLPGAGGDCGIQGTFFRCATGFFCDQGQGDTCTPLRELGQPCSYDGVCASNECGWTLLTDGEMGYGCVEACSTRWDGGT